MKLSRELLAKYNILVGSRYQQKNALTGNIFRNIPLRQGTTRFMRKKIIQTFGEVKGSELIDIFTLKRQERDFLYYNRPNPFAEKPLCWLDDGQTLFIVHPQFMLSAIFNYITNTLENPNNIFVEKYKKGKADITESMFLKQFVKIFGEGAKYHTNVCEEKEQRNMIF